LYKYLEWLERSRQYINCRYQGRYGYLSRGVMPTLAEYLQIKSFFFDLDITLRPIVISRESRLAKIISLEWSWPFGECSIATKIRKGLSYSFKQYVKVISNSQIRSLKTDVFMAKQSALLSPSFINQLPANAPSRKQTASILSAAFAFHSQFFSRPSASWLSS